MKRPSTQLALSLLTALCALTPSSGMATPLLAQTVRTAFSGQPWLTRVAQIIPSAPASQQGSQVTLNGRTLPVAWNQRQQRIGVADAGLMQALGVELLSTSDATKQPVQWFSEPGMTPMVLNTWLAGQYRYLDITDLARQMGWQIQVNRDTLQIVTPRARITSVRQGRQVWGDRIVLDLDRATPWQISEQTGEITITLDAQADPALIQNFVAGPANRLTSLKVETRGTQTLVRLGVPTGIRSRVWTLPNPNRLIIDVRPDFMVDRDISWTPGIRWRQQTVALGSSRFPVVSLLVNLRQPGLSLKPIVSNPGNAPGIAPLITTAQRWQVVAAINGGFFNRNNQLPLGAIRQDNRWLSGPILNRGAIAWNEAGEVAIGRLSLQETLSLANGQRFPLLLLNSGYVQAGLARYTPEWGPTYTPLIDNEVVVSVQNDRVVSQQPMGTAGQTTVPIPANGYLVVIRANGAAANALAVGTTLRVENTTTPVDFNRYSQILGAGPLLLQNRQIVLNAQAEQFTDAFIRQAAPRSAIGTTADGQLVMVAVHNRVGGAGPTLTEIAQVMQQMGIVNALNLDGGSSTTLYLGGRLLDRSPLTAARVHNGIGVFMQPSQ